MGKLSQWREASSWRLEKRRGSWRNARRRGGKTNTQEPSRFPDMNMSPTFSPPPTNTTRLTRQGSPFHEAPPQRQGEGDSGKPWLPRPVLSVLVSARKPQAPSVRGNRDSWSLSLPLSLPPAPPPASSLRNKPCQSPGACPRLTLSWQAQEDGAALTCASRSPCVPGYKGGLAQAPCRLPKGCQMWLRFPSTNPFVCHTPGD